MRNALVQRLGETPLSLWCLEVVTEYCVSFAAKACLERGRRVLWCKNAIETLKQEDGEKTIAELLRLGARLTTTDQALRAIGR